MSDINIGLNTVKKSFSRQIRNWFCCQKIQEASGEERLYEKGMFRLEQDLNQIGMIEAIHKLKAAVSVLISDDPEKIRKIKKAYKKRVVIDCEESEEDKDKHFTEFVDRSEVIASPYSKTNKKGGMRR